MCGGGSGWQWVVAAIAWVTVLKSRYSTIARPARYPTMATGQAGKCLLKTCVTHDQIMLSADDWMNIEEKKRSREKMVCYWEGKATKWIDQVQERKGAMAGRGKQVNKVWDFINNWLEDKLVISWYTNLNWISFEPPLQKKDFWPNLVFSDFNWNRNFKTGKAGLWEYSIKFS